MTDTKIINPTTKGKVIQLDYDFITSLEGACCYCLSDAQVQMILAIVDYYGWSTRWFSADNVIDLQTITDLQGGLVEALMNGCCGDSAPIIFRYGAGGVYESSSDGGVTWTPAPQFDPRNTSTLYPNPNDLGIDTSHCQAADSVVEAIKNAIVQNLTETMTAAQIVAVVAAALLLFLSAGTLGVLSAQLVAVGAAILAAGVSAYQSAFTADVWDTFRCIIDTNMEDDLSFTPDDVTNIIAGLDSQFAGLAHLGLLSAVQTAGAVGLGNMARSGGGDPDASCCPACDVENFDITIFHSLPVGVLVGYGADYIDIETATHPEFGGGQFAQITTADALTCCTFVSYEKLSGADAIITAGLLCGEALWPTTEVHGFSAPADLNTFRIVTPAEASGIFRIHFG